MAEILHFKDYSITKKPKKRTSYKTKPLKSNLISAYRLDKNKSDDNKQKR